MTRRALEERVLGGAMAGGILAILSFPADRHSWLISLGVAVGCVLVGCLLNLFPGHWFLRAAYFLMRMLSCGRMGPIEPIEPRR